MSTGSWQLHYLFGSPELIEAADAFVKGFAENQQGSTVELLDGLRRELRHELQLRAVPARRVWLLIERDVRWTATAELVRTQLSTAPATSQPDVSSQEALHAIDTAFGQVRGAVRSLLPAEVQEGSTGNLARHAAGLGLITLATAQAVEGIEVMHSIAQHTDAPTAAEAAEFAALTKAVMYAIAAGA